MNNISCENLSRNLARKRVLFLEKIKPYRYAIFKLFYYF